MSAVPEDKPLFTPAQRERAAQIGEARHYIRRLKDGWTWSEIARDEGKTITAMRRSVWLAGLAREEAAAEQGNEAKRAERLEEQRARWEEEEAAAKQAADERARHYADLLIGGMTLEQVGQQAGVTRERVRQVVKEGGLYVEVKAQKAARRVEREADDRAEKDRKARERKMSVRTGNRRRRREWTDERIIAALRDWLDQGGSGRRTDWDAEGRTPSAVLVTQRIGWAKAIRRAGGTPTNELSRHRKDRWAEEDCLAAVVAFLEDPNERNGGCDAYVGWAERTGRGPSLTTVRNRFRSWSEAKRQALEWIASGP